MLVSNVGPRPVRCRPTIEEAPCRSETRSQSGLATGAVVPQGMVPAIAQYPRGRARTRLQWRKRTGSSSSRRPVMSWQPGLDAEPLVEILHCRPIPKLRKGTKELRSTRILDFKPNREAHGDLCLRRMQSPTGMWCRESSCATTYPMQAGA